MMMEKLLLFPQFRTVMERVMMHQQLLERKIRDQLQEIQTVMMT